MSERPPEASDSKTRPRLRQFSLRAMLVLVTALALVVGPWINGVTNQRLAVAEIESIGGRVTYQVTGMSLWVPKIIRVWFDDDVFTTVIAVGLNHRTIDRRMMTPTTDELKRAVAAMSTLPRLQSLSLHTLRLQDDDLAYLGPLSDQIVSLEINELYHGDLRATGLGQLSDWSKLRSLTFLTQRLDDGGFEALATLTELEHLTLGQGALDDAALAGIGKVRSLEVLQLRECRIDGGRLRNLRGLPNLKHLVLQNMVAEVSYDDYRRDAEGEVRPIGAPRFWYEKVYPWGRPVGPLDVEFPRQEYERWCEETLPGVEITHLQES